MSPSTSSGCSPQWATPQRKAHLVRLFLESGGFCIFGERFCPHPEAHHYEPFIEGVIREWVADDRAQREALWRLERARMHRIPDRRFRQGRFDTIRRELFLAHQPPYYLVGMGIDALTFRRVAKVRIASTYIGLFVAVGGAVLRQAQDTIQGVSKSKRRKAARYGKALPQEATASIGKLVGKAVQDWQRKHS